MENIFVLTDQQKDLLEKHLFPGDGKEAIAILLCGGYKGESKFKYLVHKIVKIPHEECLVRSENRVCWSTDVLKSVLEEAERKKLSVFKVHSHYESIDRFSEIDDESDKRSFHKSIAG